MLFLQKPFLCMNLKPPLDVLIAFNTKEIK